MKVFHNENGREVVYVQMQDLGYLVNESDLSVPESFFTKVFTGMTYITDSNRFDFVKFDDDEDVKFFKELEFIIDFDKYKGLTDEQLERESIKVITEINEIAEKWNSMSEEEQEKNGDLLEQYNDLKHMLKFLTSIYAVKHNEITMPFPEFVDVPKNS